jgi:hypothetical protein
MIVLYEPSAFKAKNPSARDKAKAAALPVESFEGADHSDDEVDLDTGSQTRRKEPDLGRVRKRKEPAPSTVPPPGKVWGKVIDDSVRELYMHKDCRRQWLDGRFGNPPREKEGALADELLS